MRICRIEVAGTPKPGETLPRAFATLQKNFEGGYIHADVHLPSRARAKAIVFSPDNTPVAGRRRHVAACELATVLEGNDGDAKAYVQIIEMMTAMPSGPAGPAGNTRRRS